MTVRHWYATYTAIFFCGGITGLVLTVPRLDRIQGSGQWFLPLLKVEVTYARWLSLLALLCLAFIAYRRRDRTNPKEWVIYFFLGFFVSRILYTR